MKPITQNHIYGCGIACVAYLLKINYGEALKLFSNKKDAETKGYLCKHIIKAFKKSDKNYTYSKVMKNNKELLNKKNIIVFIKRSKKYSVGHYLAKRATKWMDSWINLPNINPTKSGFRTKLPGTAQWVIYPFKNRD